MIILGIETSCDETSAGIVEKTGQHLKVKANIVATSLQIHSQNGGIIPELAAREQVKYMIPVLEEGIAEAFKFKISNLKFKIPPIDAIAITYGPGLIGSLLVGVETAKTLSLLWHKPIIPVNHMMGHIYANWLRNESLEARAMRIEKDNSTQPPISSLQPQFPALILVVSGGHTDLLLMRGHGDYQVIGGTRDDAAGEAFDKIARLLGLPYPGGPSIQLAAIKGNPRAIHFPRPLVGEKNYDFSFSGLKTAVYRYVSGLKQLNELVVSDLAASTQAAIIDVLVKKTMRAVEEYNVKSLLLSGGVAANDLLREQLSANCFESNVKFFAPEKKYCTDNGVMIAAAAAFNYHPIDWHEITVAPNLYY